MSQANVKPAPAFRVPEVSQADLFAFHQAHFGRDASNHFTSRFLCLGDAIVEREAAIDDEAEFFDEEEDDGLGYYCDGVKRTLTDEQIAIFRHSEIEALRRKRENPQEPRAAPNSPSIPMDLDGSDREDGELPEKETAKPVVEAKKRKKKKKRGNGNNNRQSEPRPDLRKRTWDIVDTGLESLNYGETEPSQDTAGPATQRRRITYEDD